MRPRSGGGQPPERGRIEHRAHSGLGGEQVVQRQFRGGGALAQVRDERVRDIAPECRRKRHLHRLGDDLPVRTIDIAAHGRRVHLQAFDHAGHGLERAAAGGRQFAEQQIHSPCHPPSPRSCSLRRLARPASRPARDTAGRREEQRGPPGLRLCGMVEEPPRPGPLGSAASPSSICIISEMSRAALARAPTTSAASWAIAAMRTRWVNQGAAGRSSFRRFGQRHHDRLGLVAQRRQAAGGAAELDDPASRRSSPPSGAWRGRCRRPNRRSSGRARSAWPVAAGCGPASACGGACRPTRRRRRRWRARSLSSGGSASPSCSTMAVSITSWLVAPQWT